MSVELFRITDADVLRAKDVWESQCGMVELIGPQMATFHCHSVSPFFVAKFEWLNLAGRPIFTPRSRAAARPALVTQFIFSSSAPSCPVRGGPRLLMPTLKALDRVRRHGVEADATAV